MKVLINLNNYIVYVHINNINLKCYVGITSKLPIRRWGTNGNGYKGQLFYKAIEKYGWDNFSHHIVATNLSREMAGYIEQLLIKKLESHISCNGYNVTYGGEGYLGCDNKGKRNPMFGRHHSEETKKLLSQIHKGRPGFTIGRKHTEEEKQRMRGPRPSIAGKNHPFYGKRLSEETLIRSKEKNAIKVIQLDVNFNFVNQYDSLLEAEKATGTERHMIAKSCNKKTIDHDKWFWIYHDNQLTEIEKSQMIALFLSDKIKRTDINNNRVYIYKSMTSAETALKIDRHKISKAIKNKSICFDSYWEICDYETEYNNYLNSNMHYYLIDNEIDNSLKTLREILKENKNEN